MRITKENLTRYDQHFKSWHRRRLGYGKALENWRQTEEAGVVAFYPVGGSPLEGEVKFSFTETPPASGDKSPSNPSTITGVSSIRLLRAGKNLLSPRNLTQTVNGVTFTENADGSVTVNGTNTSTTGSAYYHVISASIGSYWRKIGFTYHLSGCPSGGSSSTYYITAFGGASMTDFGSGATRTMASAGASSVAIAIAPSASVTNLVFWPQLELGSVATAFEKFAGDEYTIPLGNTYYGGEIDLVTGLMTVTQIGYELDSSSGWYATSADYTYRTLKSKAVTITGQNYNAITPLFKCSHFTLSTSDTTLMPDNAFYPRGDGNIVISTANLSLQDFKDWLDAQKLAGTPFVVTYPLAEPQTIQLSPLALTVLAQNDHYTPRLNTVYTDADSIQITYQKSPIRIVTEQEQVILSLGGNI